MLYIIFSNKIGYLLKHHSNKSIIDSFPNDEFKLVWSPYLIRGCSITLFLYVFSFIDFAKSQQLHVSKVQVDLE